MPLSFPFKELLKQLNSVFQPLSISKSYLHLHLWSIFCDRRSILMIWMRSGTLYLLKGTVSIKPFQYFGTQRSILKIIYFQRNTDSYQTNKQTLRSTQSHRIICILTEFTHYKELTRFLVVLFLCKLDTPNTTVNFLPSVSSWCKYKEKRFKLLEVKQ